MSFKILTPHRGVFLHLLLIGIPFRFGILPTGWGRGWLFPWLGDPCTSIFDVNECSRLERFCVRDFGVRFLLGYELAGVVWYIMRKTRGNVVAFHKILLLNSMFTLLTIAWMQNYFHPDTHFEFRPEWFNSVVFYTLAALALSLWTVRQGPPAMPPQMKWSIPGNAVFIGAVVNLFVAVASFQALFRPHAVEDYYSRSVDEVTPLVRVCFALSAVYTLVHSILLLRIRTFLNMPQLRTICLYKLLVGLVLPIFWFPELSPHMNVDQRVTFALRAMLVSTYLFGYLWAGKAEGVSRILSGEKED